MHQPPRLNLRSSYFICLHLAVRKEHRKLTCGFCLHTKHWSRIVWTERRAASLHSHRPWNFQDCNHQERHWSRRDSQNLLPDPKIKKQKGKRSSAGKRLPLCSLLCSRQSRPVAPQGVTVPTVISLGLWHACALCGTHSGSLALPFLGPAPQLEAC